MEGWKRGGGSEGSRGNLKSCTPSNGRIGTYSRGVVAYSHRIHSVASLCVTACCISGGLGGGGGGGGGLGGVPNCRLREG